MAKTRPTKSVRRAALDHVAPDNHTRATRLEAIGRGDVDPVAPDDTVLTRAVRLEFIGAGESDPALAAPHETSEE